MNHTMMSWSSIARRCPSASTILIAVVLVLCTDAAWSWWFVKGIDHHERDMGKLIAIGHTRREINGRQDTRIAYHWTSPTWSMYASIRHDYQWPSAQAYELMYPGPDSFNSVAPGWLRRAVDHAVLDASNGGRAEHRFASVGWPIRVTWVGLNCESSGNSLIAWTGIPLDEQMSIDDSFEGLAPLRPILAGQLVYWAFWIAVVSTSASSLRWTRGRWRRWRGRCAGCGYDLRGRAGEVCSECGLAVHRRTR